MKHCISRVISVLTQLWRTVKGYVCKVKLSKGEITIDTENVDINVLITPSNEHHCQSSPKTVLEEEFIYDGKSNSLLESTRNEEIQSSEREGD